MRKLISILLICVTIMSMTACANTRRFESECAMMEHLNGMWVVDDNYTNKTYYIFQDGKIYNFNDVQFSGHIEEYFDSFVSDGKVGALSKLDYAATIGGMDIQTVLGSAEENVAIQPNKGKIIIDEGKTYETNIIVTEETVSIKKVDKDNGANLVKLSDAVDFTGEHFKEIFDKTKKNYTMSSAQFWTDTKEYGAMVKAYNPEVDGWELTTNTKNEMVYESSKWVTAMSGALIITDNTVSFTRKFTLPNSWNSGVDWNPIFTVLYTPEQNKIMIADIDNLSLDIPLLVQYGANAVKNFPGAYDDYMELYDVLASEDGTTKNGALIVEKTINGLTYKIQVGTDGYWAIFTITANSEIPISSIASSSGNNTSNGGNISNGGNTPNGGNSSNGSNTSNGGAAANSGNTSPQPTSCSHNYTDATCTTPQTCKICGATTGSTLFHSWQYTSCTTPEACSTCGQELVGSASGHQWREATCSAPKTCQTCKTTEGTALPHNMNHTKCTMCDYTDFSEYTLTSNTFCSDSWFKLDGARSQDLEDGEASINIDSNGVCKVTFDKYSYTFTLVQSEFDVYGLHFKCYMNGEQVKNTELTFYFSQNRCNFFLYGGTLGFSQVALNFDM